MNITASIKTVKSVITANSPVLLVGTAIAGVVATGVLAAKGGYKARGIIDDAQRGKTEPLSMQEKVQLTWLCYAVPGVTAASTILSVVGVHTIHTKRHAALAGLYAVTSNKLDSYTEKAEELLGAKKTQQLNDSVAQERVDGVPFLNSEVIMTGNGKELCFDETSGRYFMSSMQGIESAFNDLNRQLIDDGDATLNDFYDKIGLPGIPLGADIGWSGEKVNPRFGATTSPEGHAAISVWFQKEPKPPISQ